jgi:glycosyltransferase involved in cell wall biosynthesis
MKRVCIITTRHVSYNPRVLKEADTLHAAGYVVSVVTVNNHSRQRAFDEQLMSSRHWRLVTVNFRKDASEERLRWAYLSIKQRLFISLSRITHRFGIAERSAEKSFDGLVRMAKREKADLYIAHHPEALGAGARAAKAKKAKLGFDAEDFHTGMNEGPAPADSIVEFLERKYLPQCNYLTAASEGIGKAYAGKYGIEKPTTILNVFPREGVIPKKPNDSVKFYWYSQVIGPNRGLELLIEAAGRIKAPFELHLRGSLQNEEYRRRFNQLAGAAGIGEKIFYHEPILPEDIISDGSNFDLGLALESAVSVNRNMCVTNKVFSYLMSGLALIITDTYGQKDIFNYFPEVGRMCRMDDPEDLAAAMQFYIDHPEELLEAKKAARKAAETRFNWDIESKKLLDNIKACLT